LAAGSLSSRSFWVDTTERAVRTFAQATLAAAATTPTWWPDRIGVGGAAAAISVLTSLAGIGNPASDPNSASVLPAKAFFTAEKDAGA
jgi:hypothetical protein